MSLNKIERLKAERAPADVASSLAALDYCRLDEAQRFYLKNYGIYNIKMRPERFMLRLRIDGGAVDAATLERILSTAEKYVCDVIVTARAQLELHGLTCRNVYEAYRTLHEAGITTHQTLTDNVRAIVTDPLEGVRKERVSDARPVVDAMRQIVLDNPAYLGTLPRKFNTAVTASTQSHLAFFGNDLVFIPAKKEDRWGLNVYVGGKNSDTARPLDMFCTFEDAPAVFKAVLDAFIAYGLRGSRAKTRLYHLLEAEGVERFRTQVEEKAQRRFVRAGKTRFAKCDATVCETLADGTCARRIETHHGSVSIKELKALAQQAHKTGAAIRLGADQALYLVGIASEVSQKESRALHMTVCAGERYCALSLWDMKEEADTLPLARLRALGVRVGMSGCLKGCGRHYHTDIGLVGLRTNAYGPTQKAARVFLGGLYTLGEAPARMIYASVPLKHLNALIGAILDEFEHSGLSDVETFSRRFLTPHSEGFLAMWFAAKLYLRRYGIEISLREETERLQYERLRTYEMFPHFEADEGYMETIRYLTHALWDDKEL